MVALHPTARPDTGLSTETKRLPSPRLSVRVVRKGTAMKRIVRLVIVVLVACSLLGSTAQAVFAQHDEGPHAVYFPQTGHYLKYGFLDYWHHNGDLKVFGYPISEEFTDPSDNLTVQYFQRAVFEWHPDASSAYRIQLRLIGSALTADRLTEKPFQRVNAATNATTTFFPPTGHRLSSAFRDFWQANGGLIIFGYPISEEFTENGLTVQYFERAKLEWHPDKIGTPYAVQLGLLGSEMAIADQVNQAPLPRALDTAEYDPNLWYTPLPPDADDVRNPSASAPTDQAKWIEVDLSDQYLRAWERSSVVYGAYVSTGVPAHPTPVGTFYIMAKYAQRDLTGGTASAVELKLPDVPDVMYFYDDLALTGTYWHSAFGTPMSTGSVNLPLQAAEWIYNWAPYDTTVWIHD